MSDPDFTPRYTKAELEAIPTLHQVDGAELKIDTHEKRVWLTPEGTICVERPMEDQEPDREPGRSHAIWVTDRWRTTEEYPA